MTMRASFLLLTAGVLFSLTTAAAPKPAITVRHLHDAMIVPASDALFNVGREAPHDDKAWAALLNSAVVLAESGMLLQTGGRARDKGDWTKWSRALSDAGLVAVEAAQARKVEAVLHAGDELVTICEDCHEKYRDNGRSMHK
jgi:cytochrome c556